MINNINIKDIDHTRKVYMQHGTVSYRDIFNCKNLKIGFKLLKYKAGIDSVSEKEIITLSNELKTQAYSPAKQNMLKDKIVQATVQSLLESLFQPEFRNSSHGFRPRTSCHTALAAIKFSWSDITWFISLAIDKIFCKVHHQMLLQQLENKIHDKAVIDLVRKMLNAGNVDVFKQEGILSPLFCNVFFNAFDKWMEDELIPKYNLSNNNDNEVEPEIMLAADNKVLEKMQKELEEKPKQEKKKTIWKAIAIQQRRRRDQKKNAPRLMRLLPTANRYTTRASQNLWNKCTQKKCSNTYIDSQNLLLKLNSTQEIQISTQGDESLALSTRKAKFALLGEKYTIMAEKFLDSARNTPYVSLAPSSWSVTANQVEDTWPARENKESWVETGSKDSWLAQELKEKWLAAKNDVLYLTNKDRFLLKDRDTLLREELAAKDKGLREEKSSQIQAENTAQIILDSENASFNNSRSQYGRDVQSEGFSKSVKMDKSLNYVRYGSEILLGYTGKHSEAEQILSEIELFLKEQYKLNLKLENSKITSARRELTPFLAVLIGYRAKPTETIYPSHPSMLIDSNLLLQSMLQGGYATKTASGRIRATANKLLVGATHPHIVHSYSSCIRAILGYYSFSNHLSHLWSILALYRKSCALTLARKDNLSGALAALRKYGPNLNANGVELFYPTTLKSTGKFYAAAVTSQLPYLKAVLQKYNHTSKTLPANITPT